MDATFLDQIDEQGTLIVDLPCFQCGYNLRGLNPDGGRCPECGASICETIAQLPPWIKDFDWAQSLANQMVCWWACWMLWFAALLVGVVNQGYRKLPDWQDWTLWISTVVLMVFIAIVMWRFTKTSAVLAFTRRTFLMSVTRWPLRLVSLLRPGLYLYFVIFCLNYSPRTSPKFIVVWGPWLNGIGMHEIVAGAIVIIEIASVSLYLLYIYPICAWRGGRLRLFWWFPSATLVFMALWWLFNGFHEVLRIANWVGLPRLFPFYRGQFEAILCCTALAGLAVLFIKLRRRLMNPMSWLG